MATLYFDSGEKQTIEPIVGSSYFWYSTARHLLTIKILELLENGNIKLEWAHYIGFYHPLDQRSGEISWTRDEFNKAVFGVYREPLSIENLNEDEQLCRICDGFYFESGKDFDVYPCIVCSGNGRTKKHPPEITKQRQSLLHPE